MLDTIAHAIGTGIVGVILGCVCVMSWWLFADSDQDSEMGTAENETNETNEANETNVVAIIKPGGASEPDEQYIVLYDDANRAEALRTLGRWATNQELSFTWYYAAMMSQKIRKLAEEREQARAKQRAKRFLV